MVLSFPIGILKSGLLSWSARENSLAALICVLAVVYQCPPFGIVAQVVSCPMVFGTGLRGIVRRVERWGGVSERCLLLPAFFPDRLHRRRSGGLILERRIYSSGIKRNTQPAASNSKLAVGCSQAREAGSE